MEYIVQSNGINIYLSTVINSHCLIKSLYISFYLHLHLHLHLSILGGIVSYIHRVIAHHLPPLHDLNDAIE